MTSGNGAIGIYAAFLCPVFMCVQRLVLRQVWKWLAGGLMHLDWIFCEQRLDGIGAHASPRFKFSCSYSSECPADSGQCPLRIAGREMRGKGNPPPNTHLMQGRVEAFERSRVRLGGSRCHIEDPEYFNRSCSPSRQVCRWRTFRQNEGIKLSCRDQGCFVLKMH